MQEFMQELLLASCTSRRGATDSKRFAHSAGPLTLRVQALPAGSFECANIVGTSTYDSRSWGKKSAGGKFANCEAGEKTSSGRRPQTAKSENDSPGPGQAPATREKGRTHPEEAPAKREVRSISRLGTVWNLHPE